MKKLNKKQKEHIKKALLKALHVTCYLLSAAFLILMVIVGVQSCHQRNIRGVSAESISTGNNYNYHYIYNLDEQITMTSSKRSSLLRAFDLDDGDVYWEYDEDEEFSYEYNLSSGSQVFVNNDFYLNIDSIKYIFKVYDDNDDHLFLNLKSLELGYNGGYIQVMYKVNNTYNNYLYQTSLYGDIVSDYSASSINGLLELYNVNAIDYFVFNKDFNYNAPMLVSVKSPYGNSVVGGEEVGGGLYNKFIVNTGYFISNGEVYNQIEFWYMLSDGLSFDFGDSIKVGPTGMWSYWCTYFTNIDTNTMVIVNHRDSVAYMPSSSSYGYYQANSSTWSIDSYRTIKVLNGLSDSNKDSLEQFNNNNQNSYSGNVISGDVNNIFTLIASAFTAWLPVLSTYLLPGITIGTLLFIPLVALLVFAIIRIIKK